jgi:type 1 glutamine amidotransferase
MKKLASLLLLAATGLAMTFSTASAQDAPKPLRACLILGGCCHDYAKQKDILKAGLEERANIKVEVHYTDDTSTKARFPLYEKADWAKDFDVVIHDECSADVKDLPYVENVLAAHKNGVPAVNLHCAMHSYRTGTPIWFEFIGLQSSSHGPQLPIEVSYLDKQHPITKPLTDWTTTNEELYNNVKVIEGTTPIARGKQGAGDKEGRNNVVIAWTSLYGDKKTRVFSTTLAHNNSVVADDNYLDLVTQGLLWAAGKLNDDGTPAQGYGPVKK